MNKDSKILLLGGSGLVGSSLLRLFHREAFRNVESPNRSTLDLIDKEAVLRYFEKQRPEYLFMAAGKVGGMFATSKFPAEFFYENITMLTNVIDAAYRTKVTKLLNICCSCCYPRNAPLPLQVESLGTGAMEPTMASFGMAKLAGIEMCRAYSEQYGFNAISVISTNVFGINDNFDLQTSHALPAMIRRFHEAKMSGLPYVEILGTGKPRREFMAVDDLADACLFLMQNYNESKPINVARGEDLSILELAEVVKVAVGYTGKIKVQPLAGDGVPRKNQDMSHMQSLGWKPQVDVKTAIRQTYDWYTDSLDESKGRS